MGEDGYGTTFVELIKRTGSHLGVSVVRVMIVMVVVNFEKFTSDQGIVTGGKESNINNILSRQYLREVVK